MTPRRPTTPPRPVTVALTACPATDKDGGDVLISGLFDVEEHYGIEPSAYVWSPFYVVVPHDGDKDDPDGPTYDIDDDVFLEQTDPKCYGRSLVLEREMEWAMERQDMEDRHGNDRTIHHAGFRQ